MIIDPYILNPAGGPAPGGCAGLIGATAPFVNGVGTNLHYVPVSGYYNYSIGFFMLTAAELGAAKEFNALDLYKSYTEPAGITMNNQTVKMYHTAASVLPSTVNTLGTFGSNLTLVGANAGLVVTDETTVFDGTWSQTATLGWKNLAFTNNFCYNGTDNVVFMWVNNDGSADVSNYAFWETDSEAASTSRGAYNYSDSTPPTSATYFNQRPHIQLSY